MINQFSTKFEHLSIKLAYLGQGVQNFFIPDCCYRFESLTQYVDDLENVRRVFHENVSQFPCCQTVSWDGCLS